MSEDRGGARVVRTLVEAAWIGLVGLRLGLGEEEVRVDIIPFLAEAAVVC